MATAWGITVASSGLKTEGVVNRSRARTCAIMPTSGSKSRTGPWDGAVAQVQAGDDPDPGADDVTFGGRGAHQGDLWVMVAKAISG